MFKKLYYRLSAVALLFMSFSMHGMSLTFDVTNSPAPYALTGLKVSRVDFFTDIMGLTLYPTEEILNYLSLHNNYNEFPGFTDDDRLFLTVDPKRGLVINTVPEACSSLGLPKGLDFQCGSFEECSIQELQCACASLDYHGGGTFNVVEGLDTQETSWFRPFVDSGALQADPENRDAVFQVASNFNALETTFFNQDIDSQCLRSYVHDMTQGPAASISAAPGLILRHYLMFFDREKPVWRQTANHQINFLSNVADKLPVSKAGYVVFDHIPQKPTDDDYRSIKIGYHRNIQVTHGFMENKQFHRFIGYHNPHQIINQVFTAALDLGSTNQAYRHEPVIQAWAQNVLHAAYEGTLRKAFIEGKHKVFLTLVGGGVFANDLVWIIDAIGRMIDFIKESGLQVTLMWRSSSNVHNLDFLQQGFFKLVEATGGRYVQHRNDGETYQGRRNAS